MATVTGYTAEHMDELADANIVDGDVVGDNLILTRRDGSTINAGSVRGPQGPPGTDPSIVICTSTTRPTGGDLFEGLHIYETDTGLDWVYDGATWQPVPFLLDPAGGNMLTKSVDGLSALRADGAFAALGLNGREYGPAVPTPLTSQKLKFQAGHQVVTSDAQGIITITFPVAFPATLVMGSVFPAERITGGPSGLAWYTTTTHTGCTNAQLKAQCETGANTLLTSAALRVNWFAIGI